ncbi:hypothetical protein [Actinoplanes sp. NPDC049681]|uniref:hypothetical protein n=1 Tax=Actinoplanes sp. NPDC049681 TaxID=3363905 RepID=UPI0037B90CB4
MPPDAALRYAFVEAGRRGSEVLVLAVGRVTPSDKYPAVASTFETRRTGDPVIVLCAASRRCALAVLPRKEDALGVAVLRFQIRCSHCPVVVIGDGDGRRSPGRTGAARRP